MLCSYLIQEQGYSVAEALHHFELARPPRGIRFVNIVFSAVLFRGQFTLLDASFNILSFPLPLMREIDTIISKENSIFAMNPPSSSGRESSQHLIKALILYHSMLPCVS